MVVQARIGSRSISLLVINKDIETTPRKTANQQLFLSFVPCSLFTSFVFILSVRLVGPSAELYLLSKSRITEGLTIPKPAGAFHSSHISRSQLLAQWLTRDNYLA